MVLTTLLFSSSLTWSAQYVIFMEWGYSRYVQFVGVVIPTLFLSSLTRSDRYG
uniref:Uncharacterized protein n=1 Tax=Picea glauca TaxID=3330 RepID=A0A101LV17_PICGL|nr:hypothetical protein ABT39_MTgene2238 [Picea glauca]